jgi:GAF domain-containing protein
LVGFANVTRDRTERRQAEQELARRAAQQAAVAELGLFAIASRTLQPILERAAAVVTETLGTDLAQILELQPDGQRLLVRAGVGWKEGVVGHASIPAGDESLAGSALISGHPVVIENLATERRFASTELLKEHGVVSGGGEAG